VVAGKARAEIEKRTGESVITGASSRALLTNKAKKELFKKNKKN